jgi:hypothetical protein
MPFGFLKNIAHAFGFGGREPNPSYAANQYLNQIPGILKQYAGPIAETGAPTGGEAGKIFSDLLKQYGGMATNPEEFLNRLQRSYTPSEGYKYKENQIEQALRNTAASGGFLGTPYHQQQQGGMTKDLLNEDMMEYLNNLFGIMGTGQRGAEGRAINAGQAALGLGGGLANALGEQGQLAFAQQQQANMNRNLLRNERLKLAARLLSQQFGYGQENSSMGNEQGGGRPSGFFSNLYNWYGG